MKRRERSIEGNRGPHVNVNGVVVVGSFLCSQDGNVVLNELPLLLILFVCC